MARIDVNRSLQDRSAYRAIGRRTRLQGSSREGLESAPKPSFRSGLAKHSCIVSTSVARNWPRRRGEVWAASPCREYVMRQRTRPTNPVELRSAVFVKETTWRPGGSGTVKLMEPRARGDEFWSRWASGEGACVGDLAPDSKAAVTRRAAGCSRCRFWIRDMKEVRDLIVNRQEPLRLPG